MSEFNGAGSKPGLEIWRIEKLVPVLVPEEQHGKFFSGDSYIVLKTSQKGRSLSWAIHFWLGSETTQDEAGVAAYKTVELDNLLGGGPVQYREVQSYESALFLSYFRDGIQYLAGGIESGFRHVERDSYETTLLHIKGRRNVRVTAVPVSRDSLNDGDVFILDEGLKLLVWAGKDSNRYEKAKALDVARKIRDAERGGRADVIMLDGSDSVAAEEDLFWSKLGGKGAVKSAAEGGADEEVDKATDIKLYSINDAGALEEVTQRPLTKSMLSSTSAFVLEAAGTLHLWIGKSCANSKAKAADFVEGLIASRGLPRHTRVTRMIEGTESVLFKSYFAVWEKVALPSDFASLQKSLSHVATVEQKEVDVASLHAAQVDRIRKQMPDDGSGKLEIWRVENFDLAPVDPAKYGHFQAGDSYVLLYTYQKSGRPEYIIYFWQGRDSSQDEVAASALLAKQMDDKLGGRPVQVRVVQNKEPAHFLTLFKGRMVVHQGGRRSSFRNREEADSYDTDGVSLYHVKGNDELNTRAIQVPETASSLNSGDCFVLLTPGTVFVWRGKGANDLEREVAANVAANLPQGAGNVELVDEGEEPESFWAALGGKGEYATVKELEHEEREPRLFHCSNATGTFKVEEVADFCQDDLIDDDVMLLDTFTQVFVWVGSQSNSQERSLAVETARKYITSAPDGRSAHTPITVVEAGHEPVMFSCHFRGWDSAKAQSFQDPYEARLAAIKAQQANKPAPAPRVSLSSRAGSVVAAEIAAASSTPAVSSSSSSSSSAPAAAPAAAAAAAAAPASGSFLDPATNKFGYDDLVNKTIPDTVDMSRREAYLADAQFQQVFGMSPSEFAALPKWKQVQKKKDLKLF